MTEMDAVKDADGEHDRSVDLCEIGNVTKDLQRVHVRQCWFFARGLNSTRFTRFRLSGSQVPLS